MREDSDLWGFSAQFAATASGSFFYVPAGEGLYHFELVAEDTVGNRSAAPAGIGQGSTNFLSGGPSTVTDWGIYE